MDSNNEDRRATSTTLHVAIIMDGNGRWAAGRRRSRLAGHRAGAEAVRRTVEAAPDLGIGTLTLFAFSADNWRRPPREITAIMHLMQSFLETETRACAERGIRLSVIGRRDRIPAVLATAIAGAETATRDGTALDLRLAVDYSGRDAILRAAGRAIAEGEITRESLTRHLGQLDSGGAAGIARVARDVDLVIRTGGERRLSDFLLWESAYAELVFTPRMWPDFDAPDLAAAVAEFHRRDRRFGGLSGSLSPMPLPHTSAVSH